MDNSPLSRYVMHPFWDQVVKIYPKWLAPNLITFTGFLCLIVQWALFTVYDNHFYGYCFDRNDCLPQNEANLTARSEFFHSHLKEFNYQVPPNVCSCIPGWLWLVLTITQFLSHHLGIYSVVNFLKTKFKILVFFSRRNWWKTSTSHRFVLATRRALWPRPRLVGYSLPTGCSLLNLRPLGSVRHQCRTHVRFLVGHFGQFHCVTLGKIQHGHFVLALVLWLESAGKISYFYFNFFLR